MTRSVDQPSSLRARRRQAVRNGREQIQRSSCTSKIGPEPQPPQPQHHRAQSATMHPTVATATRDDDQSEVRRSSRPRRRRARGVVRGSQEPPECPMARRADPERADARGTTHHGFHGPGHQAWTARALGGCVSESARSASASSSFTSPSPPTARHAAQLALATRQSLACSSRDDAACEGNSHGSSGHGQLSRCGGRDARRACGGVDVLRFLRIANATADELLHQRPDVVE